MNITSVFLIIISGLLIYVETVAISGRTEGNAEEVLDEHEEEEEVVAAPIGNETFSAEAMGPPDSHEAMNNRDITPKSREKRSYEFLMGLINNNSKYEVTRVDPAATKKVTGENIAASELLLELMVRIAAHPDQWDKVHQLLHKIDTDLKTSKSIVEKLRNGTEERMSLNKKESWPKFDFVNTNKEGSKEVNKSASKTTYPKNFAYHRVTGKPFYLNKSPKAYIAVSVIAPKPVNTIRSAGTTESDDLMLENELQQLKPWSHEQNLKNMEKLRARWVIQTDEKKETVAPNLL